MRGAALCLLHHFLISELRLTFLSESLRRSRTFSLTTVPPRPTTLTSYSRSECSACPVSPNVTNGVPWLILRTLTVLMLFLHLDTHLTVSLGDFLQPQAHYIPVLIGTDTKESGFPAVGGNSTPVPARETTKPADVDCKCPTYLWMLTVPSQRN